MMNMTDELSLKLKSLLTDRGLSISTAESCTAGGIGAAIAAVDGASVYYKGGVVSYATELKVSLLGVSKETIAFHGVVSEETAIEMNEGVKRLTHSDLAVSVTGYIGTSGGDDFAPNGTVWLCVASNEGPTTTKRLTLSEDRTTNAHTVIKEALLMVVEYLKENLL